MSKLNLSEAAAEILQGSAKNAPKAALGDGYKPNVKAPQQGEVEIGTAGHKTTDDSYEATKGVPTATAPGAKPPVGSEPMKKLSGQPAQSGTANQPEGSEDSDESKRDRKASAKLKQTMSANKGAITCAEDEDEEDFDYEDEELEEATMEEVQRDLKELDDKKFAKKYGMSKKEVSAKLAEMQQKDSMKEEASVEEVLEDLEEMDDETFEETYGLSKEDAVSHLEEIFEDYDDDDDIDTSTKFKRKIIKGIRKDMTPQERKDIGWNKKTVKRDVQRSFKAARAAHEARKDKSMKEDVDAMLSGENLSEEFKQKASMIFEAAVEARVEEIAEELEEKYTREFEETLEVVKEDFAEKLDSYLDYVVENWMADNQLAVEKGLRSEIVEDFIGALKNVFVEHYIDIPEEKVDIVEQLVDKVDELEEEINEQILKNIDLKKSISEHQKVEVIHAVCEGLSLSQVEKIKSLAKNVEFVSEEDFAEKLEAIKESYFPSGVVSASSDSLNDTVEIDEDYTTKVVDPLIESYVSKISKLTKF